MEQEKFVTTSQLPEVQQAPHALSDEQGKLVLSNFPPIALQRKGMVVAQLPSGKQQDRRVH